MTQQESESEYKDMRRGPLTKSKLAIGIAALIMLFILALSELSPLGELLPGNGITRKDVAKFRIHVLQMPNLEKIKTQMTGVNVTAPLTQLATSRIFRADGSQDFFAYFRLNDKFDFDEWKPDDKGIFKDDVNVLPYYSFALNKGKIAVLKNDTEVAQLDCQAVADKGGRNLDFRKSKPMIINYGKSAVLYNVSENEDKNNLMFIEDLEKPTETKTVFFAKIVQAAADRYGKQFFAITKRDKGDSEWRISGINFDGKNPKVAHFDIPVGESTTLYHCAPARALALVDGEKVRIVDASSGSAIATIYHRELFKDPKTNQEPVIDPNNLPRFAIVPGVPAAIFRDILIDLRSGDTVDALYDYGPDSVFAVDFNSKRLYYSTFDNGGKRTPYYMSINAYDLHDPGFLFQVTLGNRSLIEDDNVDRQDNICSMFTTPEGQLVALSKPAK